jgi:hypothetical protein
MTTQADVRYIRDRFPFGITTDDRLGLECMLDEVVASALERVSA